MLLITCKKLVKLGRPVSIRNKDLYRNHIKQSTADKYQPVFGVPEPKILSKLVEQGFNFFNSENKNRKPYTELEDARKHLVNDEFFLSSISLQNAAYYIGIAGLSNRSIKLETVDFLSPESEIELIQKTKEVWLEFYHFYKRLHTI